VGKEVPVHHKPHHPGNNVLEPGIGLVTRVPQFLGFVFLAGGVDAGASANVPNGRPAARIRVAADFLAPNRFNQPGELPLLAVVSGAGAVAVTSRPAGTA
jgi:hypothetical protein